MRKNIVAGNWKMNTSVTEGVVLAKEVAKKSNSKTSAAEVVVAPPFIHLTEVKKALSGSNVLLAAQNCATEDSGAYTGETSAKELKAIGVDAVIIGHSERRSYYLETGELLAAKVAAALKHDLVPIFCVGEKLEEREAEQQNEVVQSQLAVGLFSLTEEEFSKVVIAYEPVWAIGTGKTASVEQAQEIHAYIRSLVSAKYNETVADNTTILYGGSCKPSNAVELFSAADIDGGLIGGAALNATDFEGIFNAF